MHLQFWLESVIDSKYIWSCQYGNGGHWVRYWNLSVSQASFQSRLHCSRQGCITKFRIFLIAFTRTKLVNWTLTHIQGILKKTEQRCQNSLCQENGKLPDGSCEKYELQPILATISCTENTLPYLQGAEYYQEAQCQRKMCQCLPGFSNNGWNCSPDVEVRLITFYTNSVHPAVIMSTFWKSSQ